MVHYAKHWVFTLNNYTEDEYTSIRELFNSDLVEYIVVGRETGDSGTPHLQGYVCFRTRKRLSQVKNAVGQRVHAEKARGTPTQASDYCKKDGQYEESGALPNGPGHRTDIDAYKSWVLQYYADNGRRPTERDIALEHSSLWLRYSSRLMSLRDMLCPSPRLVDGTLNPWQDEVYQEIDDGTYHDREIMFVVDTDGGKGKSWFCRYVMTKKPNHCQLLSIGKRDDLAHAIDESKSIFLFNVPRGQMEYLRYEVLEQLKDQTVFSPKYLSTMKILEKTPFVAVFSNEHPDMDKMTEDRYNIKLI